MKRLLSIGLWRPWRTALCAVCLGASVTYAADSAQVTITQKDSLGNSLASAVYGSTEASFTSVTAPSRSGYYFTHWSVEPADTPNFVNRDILGRALDQVSVVPKGDTTLVANYQAVSVDTDEDGVADGREIYWYGDLDEIATSDTDGDGYTFAQEMQYNMNPLLPDGFDLGGIIYGDSSIFWYNPNNNTLYTIQKNLDGVITVVETSYLAKGASKTTPSYSASQGFAYWTINGVPQADVLGRALDTVTFVGTGEAEGGGIVAEAILLSDADARALAYWYGVGTDKTMESDTDGDGYTLAQEVQYNMNPHLPDGYDLGGVIYGDSSIFWYNPNSYSPYKIQTNQDGTITVIESGFLKKDETKTTASYASNSTFAYWDINSVRQADVFGRARDQVTLVGTGTADAEQVATANFLTSNSTDRALAYWYNPDSGVTADSDTDGDGYTLAQEVQYGMNPHLPDGYDLGGVNYGDGPTLETNLQPFDMGSKAIVDGNVVDFFATLDGMTGNLTGGLDFNGARVTPAIVDVNSDGVFDLVVATPSTITLYKNMGQPGATNFTIVEDVYPALQKTMATMVLPVLVGGRESINGEEQPVLWVSDQGKEIFCYLLKTDELISTGAVGFPTWEGLLGIFQGDTLTLADGTSLSCDGVPSGITSVAMADATQDDVRDLLIADNQGRISLYTATNGVLNLRHRVWGGTSIGFAEGLVLAPVDWDADGDLDAVCGTSDGHLLLLTDPGVGRPVNLVGTVGYDNVLLEWEPNRQSRVCGYGVYRAEDAAGSFSAIEEVPLPTYRDTPPAITTWAYRVTALSRLWRAGFSTPEIYESAPSEVLEVDLGSVGFALSDAAGFYGQTVKTSLSIENSKGLAAKDLSVTVLYDAAVLTPESFSTSGLSEGLVLSELITIDETTQQGQWQITSTGGTLRPGAGELFGLSFKVADEGSATSTEVQVVNAQAYALGGQSVAVVLPFEPTSIALASAVEPTVVELFASPQVASTWPLTIPVEVLVDEAATFDWESLTLTPTYDSTLMTLVSTTPATAASPTATFVFDCLPEAELPASRSTEVTFTGTATAAEIEATTCTVLLPSDTEWGDGSGGGAFKPSGTWWKPLVVLSVDARDHARLIPAEKSSAITVHLEVWAMGWLNWQTLTITPTFDTTQLELVEVSKLKRVNYWKGVLTYTFRAKAALHSRHLWVTFDATGKSWIHPAIEAVVYGTQTRLHLEGFPHPGIVQPWTQGDCNGDGRLTEDDYRIAIQVYKTYYHKPSQSPEATPEAKAVAASICQAIGKPTGSRLKIDDITSTYKKYLKKRTSANFE